MEVSWETSPDKFLFEIKKNKKTPQQFNRFYFSCSHEYNWIFTVKVRTIFQLHKRVERRKFRAYFELDLFGIWNWQKVRKCISVFSLNSRSATFFFQNASFLKIYKNGTPQPKLCVLQALFCQKYTSWRRSQDLVTLKFMTASKWKFTSLTFNALLRSRKCHPVCGPPKCK